MPAMTSPAPYSRWRHWLAGVSLVEVMVAMTLGMIIIAGLGYIYLSAASAFRSLEAASRVQENVRFAFERISHDVRMAGFTGCSYSQTFNELANPSIWYQNLFGRPLTGYDDASAAIPAEFASARDGDSQARPRLRGDALVVLRADDSRDYLVAVSSVPELTLGPSYDPVSRTMKVPDDIVAGERLVATDCNRATLLQAQSAVSAGTLAINVSDSTKLAMAPFRMHKFLGSAYYIANNDSGEPALYWLRLSDGLASPVAVELVPGVEAMEVRYGVDTGSPPDGSVDVYTSAEGVLAAAAGATDDDKWRRVLAVRVSLVTVSTAAQQINSQIVPYWFGGVQVTPGDRRMRKVFTTTIAIRNPRTPT
jgi:type IV pilus assembly protein PilW